MEKVVVLRDLVIVDIDDREALAQHMADLYALAGEAHLALSHFRQFRSTSDLATLERALDHLQGRVFMLECGFRAG